MKVVVIGAGIGGLTAALDLASSGHEVSVLERATHVGGKIREQTVAGRAIDCGPTVLTMRWVFDELFEAGGGSFERDVPLTRARVLATHGWDDGSTLDLFEDPAQTAEAIGRFAGAADARGYLELQRHTKRILETVLEPFLRAQRPGPVDLLRALGPLGFGAVPRIDAHRSMARALSSFFVDRRLRQLFGRYATYAGSSPLLAPATLLVIAEVEREGVWLVEGGMARLASAVERLARARGVTVRTGCEVREIRVAGGRAVGVELADGERIDADAVVANGDVAALATGAFGAKASVAAGAIGQRSLSAVTWGIVARVPRDTKLARHNVFFGADSDAEFRALFKDGTLPSDPTVYLAALDRETRATPTDGVERFFCIVNAPANGDRGGPSPGELDSCQHRAFERLARWARWEPLAIARTTPVDFERSFPRTGGALYGAASHGAMAMLARPSARTRLPGLYLSGGSVHPGAGVPMAALSGRLAASALRADWSSMRRSRTVAIGGSTSTS